MKNLTFELGLKAMSHEEICPCTELVIKGCSLGCLTYATCFATCNEIIFYARRVFKNVSGILIMSYCDWILLKKIARQVAVAVSHVATCRVALQKVEAASTVSTTCNTILRCETSCKHGVSHKEVFLATCNAIVLQVARKIASCDMALTFIRRFYYIDKHSTVYELLCNLVGSSTTG